VTAPSAIYNPHGEQHETFPLLQRSAYSAEPKPQVRNNPTNSQQDDKQYGWVPLCSCTCLGLSSKRKGNKLKEH